MGRALDNIETGKKYNDKYVTFNLCQYIKKPNDISVVSIKDKVDKDELVVPIEASSLLRHLQLW